MLHLRHLGHQIRRIEQRRRCVAAGDHHMLGARTLGQRGNHLVDVDPAPLQWIGELVEHIEVVPFLGESAGDLGPTLRSRGGMIILRARLARPRPSGAHLVPLDGTTDTAFLMRSTEFGQRGLFADLPLRALDELEDRDVEALIPGAQRHSERGRRLPLPRAGVHGQQWSVAPLTRRQSVTGNSQWLTLWHRRTFLRTGIAETSTRRPGRPEISPGRRDRRHAADPAVPPERRGVGPGHRPNPT